MNVANGDHWAIVELFVRGLNDETQKLGSAGRLDSPCDFRLSCENEMKWVHLGRNAARARARWHCELRESICVRIGKLFHNTHFIHSVGIWWRLYSMALCALKMVVACFFWHPVRSMYMYGYEWHTRTLAVVSSTLVLDFFLESTSGRERNRKTRSHYNSQVNNEDRVQCSQSRVCNSFVQLEQSNWKNMNMIGSNCVMHKFRCLSDKWKFSTPPTTTDTNIHWLTANDGKLVGKVQSFQCGLDCFWLWRIDCKCGCRGTLSWEKWVPYYIYCCYLRTSWMKTFRWTNRNWDIICNKLYFIASRQINDAVGV